MHNVLKTWPFLVAAALSGCTSAQEPMLTGTPSAGAASSSSRVAPQSALQRAAPFPAANRFLTVYSFKGGMDGAGPQGSMIDLDGTLFGMTHDGGATGNGTVFTYHPATLTETVIYNFAGGADGSGPTAGLLNVGDTLYGTTSSAPEGGFPNGQGNGSVFAISRAGAEHVLHTFAGAPDGANPESDLIDVNGLLYGTTITGGTGSCQIGSATGCGTVFRVNRITGQEKVMYNFAGGTADGDAPRSGLVEANGLLFGTTYYGGASNDGTVFSVNPSTGAESVVHSFTGSPDGSRPQATMTVVNGILYGTTDEGGRDGTVFSINPVNGAESIVSDVDGGPESGVIALPGETSALYGTDSGNGSPSGGQVFSVTLAGVETVLHAFRGGANGGSPEAGLVDHNGTLFGTARLAGANGFGTIFRLEP